MQTGRGIKPPTRHPAPRRARHRWFASGASVIALCISLFPVARSGATAAAQEDPTAPTEVTPDLVKVGELTVFEPDVDVMRNGFLVLDSTRRRGYQIYWAGSPVGGSGLNFTSDQVQRTIVHSFDLDTLAPIARREIEGFSMAKVGSRIANGDVIHALDAEGGRLFLAGYRIAANGVTSEFAVARFDLATFDDTTTPNDNVVSYLTIPAVQAPQLTGRHPFGMTFHAKEGSGKLLLLFSLDSRDRVAGFDGLRPVYEHYLVQWNADTGSADWGGAPYRIAACQTAPLVNQDASWFYPLAILRGADSIHLPCQAAANVTQAVRLRLGPTGPISEEGVTLPRPFVNVLADPVSERLVFMIAHSGLSYWVYDGKAGAFVGSLGAVLWTGFDVGAGIDESTGRLYSQSPNHLVGLQHPVAGGLMLSDVRLTPAPQLTNYAPELQRSGIFRLVVDPEDVTTGRPRRVFARGGRGSAAENGQLVTHEAETAWAVVRDTVPVSQIPSASDLDRNTVDVEEQEGVTEPRFDASASGFGLRTLLISGVNAAVSQELGGSNITPSPCYKSDRELRMGAVDTAQLSNLIGSARSASLDVDLNTKNDFDAPATRCYPGTLGHLVPAPEAATAQADTVTRRPWDDDAYIVECAGDGDGAADHSDALQSYHAEVGCSQEAAEVHAAAIGKVAPSAEAPVTVASASSTVTLARDPERGIVAQVESIARGIEIAGVGHIEVVRTVAEGWAGGRPGTAGTNADKGLQRVICGVRLPNLVREPCGDPKPVVDALNRILGRNGEARLREPDADLVAGTPGGYLSAIQRDSRQAFNDKFITRDGSNSVPGLEIIFYKNDSPQYGPGRQVFQFAGVQTATAYGISCVLGATDDGKSCNEPPAADPASLRILLTDVADDAEDGVPLEGAVFKVYDDTDGDGEVGVLDELIDDGTCTTTDDGTGNCQWEGLAPGSYVIEEVTPPVGYAAASPFGVELASGLDHTVRFFNLPSIGGVKITLSDDSAEAKPLAGGVFEMLADDGDGTVSAADLRYAGCTTTSSGACTLKLAAAAGSLGDAAPCLDAGDGEEGCAIAVPLGAYVVRQTTAPAGYAPASPIPFELANSGSMAELQVRNGLEAVPATVGTPGTPGSEAVVEEAGAEVPRVDGASETVIVEEGRATPAPIVSTTPLEKEDGPVAAVTRVVRQLLKVPAQAMRFLFSSPRELGLMAAVWALLWAPCYLGERRRVLRSLTAEVSS